MQTGARGLGNYLDSMFQVFLGLECLVGPWRLQVAGAQGVGRKAIWMFCWHAGSVYPRVGNGTAAVLLRLLLLLFYSLRPFYRYIVWRRQG